jgi:hypothetical protein
MPVDDSYLPYALTTVGICVPTYLLILIVNNPDNVTALLTNVGLFLAKLTSCAVPKRSERLKERILERKDKVQQAEQRGPLVQREAPPHASLEARLSHDLSAEASVRGSPGFLQATSRRVSQSITEHLPGGRARHDSRVGAAVGGPTVTGHGLATCTENPDQEMAELDANRKRSSTIKFDEPLYTPSLATHANKHRATTAADSDEDARFGPPSRWDTGMSGRTTLQDLDRSSPSASPISPGGSPPPTANGMPMPSPPITSLGGMSLEAIREQSVNVHPRHSRGPSLFRRFSDRFSPTQMSPRGTDSGGQSPQEPV